MSSLLAVPIVLQEEQERVSETKNTKHVNTRLQTP